MIVTDTNVISYLYLPTAYTAHAERLLLKDPEWCAPILWRSEFRNVLALYIRKGILAPSEAIQIQAEAESLLSEHEYDVSSQDVLTLAAESGCSAYDCEFVSLAFHLGVPLITMDKKILRAFPDTARALA